MGTLRLLSVPVHAISLLALILSKICGPMSYQVEPFYISVTSALCTAKELVVIVIDAQFPIQSLYMRALAGPLKSMIENYDLIWFM